MSASVPVAFAVLGNRTEGTRLASTANVILIMLVICALLVIGYGLAIATAIMRPIEEIEEGVLQVINGKTDHRLQTDSAELGGLAFRINQLLNVFTGTEETSEDEEGKLSIPPSEAHWKDAEFSDQGGRPNAAVAVPRRSRAVVSERYADDVVDDPKIATCSARSRDSYQDRSTPST